MLNRVCAQNCSRSQRVGILILCLLAMLLVWFNYTNSGRAMDATPAQVRFAGEYRIGDGPWQEIQEGQHIPATKGDVTLRGNFHLYSPGGEYVGVFASRTPLAFYTDHINLTFRESGLPPYVIDHENPQLGAFACGVDWTAHAFSGDGTQPIEILIHNPHRFGNETAIDAMLSNVAIWGSIDFERGIMAAGQAQRNSGMFFAIISFVLLGSALFSALLHIQSNRIICLLGITVLSAGVYLVYSAPGVPFWSKDPVINTCLLGFSVMFYMLFVSGIIPCFLDKTYRIGHRTVIAMGITDGICFVLPVLTGIKFYDILLPWVIAQSIANAVLLACLLRECLSSGQNRRWVNMALALLVMGAFWVDAAATAMGCWEGGVVSRHVFLILFVAALFVTLRTIPEGINAAEKARDLELERSRLEAEKAVVEAELKESRVAIMLSQIQPHFIYNTLGTIERMCQTDPEKAFQLVRNFSLYLRGNFGELDNVAPIRFAEELKHVEYYVNIERVRFPDMTIEYNVETTDFVLPALSVQPLVENAIKHGLMRRESGGRVEIHSYETPTHVCVEVTDDGVGFDTTLPMDEKKHVGLRNIRGRLSAMVNGELILESSPGVGTKAIIRIPKEVGSE